MVVVMRWSWKPLLSTQLSWRDTTIYRDFISSLNRTKAKFRETILRAFLTQAFIDSIRFLYKIPRFVDEHVDFAKKFFLQQLGTFSEHRVEKIRIR